MPQMNEDSSDHVRPAEPFFDDAAVPSPADVLRSVFEERRRSLARLGEDAGVALLEEGCAIASSRLEEAAGGAKAPDRSPE